MLGVGLRCLARAIGADATCSTMAPRSGPCHNPRKVRDQWFAGVQLDPSLQLTHGNQQAAPEADEPQLCHHVALEGVPRHREGSRGGLDREDES